MGPEDGLGTRSRWSAEWIFALFALVGGLVLVALIPPMLGGNEPFNFQRSATSASGHFLVEPSQVPRGVAEFLRVSRERYPEGTDPPYSYSREQFDQLASIPLGTNEPTLVQPNPIAVLHPVSYLPQIPVMAIGQALGLSPLILFYLGRLAGLAAGVALTFFAIRIIPVHKHALAAVALLPPVLFNRSTLDADQFTVGLAFLFLALVMREIGAPGRIARSTIVGLAIGAFLLAQCKSAYLLLPLLVLAIPASRFGSTRSKFIAAALIVLPGALASFGWMLTLKLTYFQGIRYRTWSGIVHPDEQMRLILADPLAYARVLLGTIFAGPFIPKTILEFFGMFGPPVSLPLPYYPVAALLLAGAIASGRRVPRGPLSDWRTRGFALAIAAVTILIILTLLYLQWTRVQAPVIQGFSGRYLYPLAPLILLALPTLGRPFFGISASRWLIMLGILSLGATWWKSWATYIA